MALKKIKEDLLKRDSEFAERKHSETPYNEWKIIEKENTGTGIWQRMRNAVLGVELTAASIGMMAVIGMVVMALIIIAGVMYYRSYFLVEHVAFTSEIPTTVDSNQTTELVFAINNDNRADLINAEITVDFDTFFVPAESQEDFTKTSDRTGVISLGTIEGKENRKASVVGHFISPKNEVESIAGELTYNVARRGGVYSSEARSTITVSSSPVTVDIVAPQKVVSGNYVELILKYRNASEQAIDDLSLVMTYPDGFTLHDTRPSVESNQYMWDIGTLAPGETRDTYVRGVIQGDIGTSKRFEAHVIAEGEKETEYASDDHLYEIIEAPLTVTQEIINKQNNIVTPGELLTYRITFKNTSEVPLRDSVIKLLLDSDVLDYEKLLLQTGGFYDQIKRQIIWRASDVPALGSLDPGQGGSLEFVVPVSSHLPVEDGRGQFMVTSIVSIDSNDLPDVVRDNKDVLSSALITKVASKILYNIEMEKNDGPLPPIVGQKTSYRVRATMGSVNNKLENAVAKMSLPSGISFLGTKEDIAEDVQYNQRSNIITWNIGSVEQGAGVTKPSREIIFDVEVIPSVNQVGKNVNMMHDIVITANDLFVNKELQKSIRTITTSDVDRSNTLIGIVKQQ
jgi:uncharacterized repeat protein (TIGR01451 family)